jgi:hypothetical protein
MSLLGTFRTSERNVDIPKHLARIERFGERPVFEPSQQEARRAVHA